jgi:hypothetical protein
VPIEEEEEDARKQKYKNLLYCWADIGVREQ